MRAGIVTLCAGFCFALARPAAAQTDFLPDVSAWNGSSKLAEICRGIGATLSLISELDWSELGGDRGATLLLLNPRGNLEVEKLVAFVRRGGRLLIADDFGEAQTLLERLGIRKLDGAGVRSRYFYDKNRNLPIALPGPASHPLMRGVRGLVTNHPAYFRSRLPTLAGFSGGEQQLLVAGQIGRGRFVALSDPSVLINGMLNFRGNLRFATNMMRYLSDGRGGRVLLSTGYLRQRGQLPPDPRTQRPASRVAHQFNAFIGRLNDFALTKGGMRALSFVFGTLALAALFFLLPTPRRDIRGHWLEPGSSPGQRRPASTLPANATWAAAVLREEVEQRLTALLEAPGPISTIHPKWLVERVRRRSGDEAAAVCARLLNALRQVPYTGRADEVYHSDRVSKRDLATMVAQSERLLRLLGADASAFGPASETLTDQMRIRRR